MNCDGGADRGPDLSRRRGGTEEGREHEDCERCEDAERRGKTRRDARSLLSSSLRPPLRLCESIRLPGAGAAHRFLRSEGYSGPTDTKARNGHRRFRSHRFLAQFVLHGRRVSAPPCRCASVRNLETVSRTPPSGGRRCRNPHESLKTRNTAHSTKGAVANGYPNVLRNQADVSSARLLPPTPVWRNWQTQRIQNPPPPKGLQVRFLSPALRDETAALQTKAVRPSFIPERATHSLRTAAL